ncbi:hypothetical protein M0804_000196 [Polistes exclamans]|nr:hypothetical protein M0804_000196 [Polistes exclamans]
MNHIKNIINTNIPCRSPSNIRITTNHNSYKSEVGIKKRYIKPRSPKIGNSFMLIMRQIHPNQEFIQSGIRSKSIANLIKKFLSDRKLPLQCNFVKNVNSKQEVNYSNGLCYDCNINYEGDRETRSYAQMITAYNNTMMTVDNSSNMIRDKLKSKMNVRLSKTHFRTTSTLSSAAYNFENLTIKENSKETSMTDLPVDTSFNHSVEIDNDFYDKDEKRKDFEIRKSIRSYANIIADYSAAMNGYLTSKKSKNHFSKLSMVSSSPENVVTPNTSDFVLSPNLNTDSRKEININEEIDWLSNVDKVIKNLKSATVGKDKRIDKDVFNLEETAVLQCVKIDEAAKVDKIKSTEVTSRKISFPGDNKNEEGLKHYKGKTSYGAEKVDGIKMIGPYLSSDYKFSTSSNVNSTFRKNLTQMPSNTESNISNDPQLELRMVPSGNESIVSVNVESIARTTEPRNPSSKELSVVVSSNNKQNLSNALATNLRDENQSNFGSMRISISEESLPVKELELFINGKPISDVRSIKARTETLNVLTSMDKVEIRVPYSQDNPNTLNQNSRNFVKNVSNPESVLKLRIATAFDETNPIITSGDTKKVQQIPTDLESKSSKKKSTRIEESNFNVIMSELSSTIKNTNESNIEKVSAIKIEKSDEVNVKKTFKRDTIEETQPVWIKSENDSLKRSNTSTFTNVHNDVKEHELTSDIDLRFTKIFGSKANVKNNLNVKEDESLKPENVSSSSEKKSVGNESYKRANLSTKDNVKSLADIMIKHSGRSSDGNSSAISGKPKPDGSNQIDDQKSSKSDKHDFKTTDAITKKSVLNNQSSKSDSLDERVSPKQSPRLSDVKSKKEEDYQRNDSTPTYVTNKQKSTQSNRTLASNDKIQSKLKVDSLDEKMSLTKWNKPSIEIKSSKAEKQYDTKDSKTFSKVLDVEKTSKSSSTFKSENVRITRDDFLLFNDETTSRSSSSPVKIVEFEKFNKRNEVSFKRGAKNVGTPKETECMKKTVDDEKKSSVQIQMKKELPKSDVVVKNIDTKINKSQQNVDNVRNEKFVHCKLTSFEEKSNVRANDKKDSSNDLEKQKKSINDSKDTKMKNIFNSMKPIEKKKDGILIDYGVKVASRKKQEKTKSTRKDLTTNENNPIVTKINEKLKEKENQCLNNRDEYKTIQSTPISVRNLIKDNQKATNETKSFKCDDAKEKHLSYVKKDIDSKAINSDKINNESLNVKLSKTLDKLKENLSYQNVPESEQSNFINYSTAKEEESTKSSKNVRTVKRSDEEFRVPYEGTVVQNPSKSPSTSHPNTVMKPLAGTIVRRPSKESEKKKPKNTSHKYSSKNTRENSNKKENQRESSYSVNLLEGDTNKSKSDLLSGSKNNSTEKPSSPVNSNNSSSFEKTKSYTTTSIDLIKSNTSNKRDYEEKNKQNNAKTREEFVNKLKRPEKDLVYSVWLQRKEEETADDKTS